MDAVSILKIYRVDHEKVSRLPFSVAFAFGYCINFCIYAMLRTRATFSWPTLYKTVTLVETISAFTASIREPRHIILEITHFKAVNNFKAVNKY
jgi:hypothetical protein